ncbi:MAG: hypothetical protein GYA76_02450 [Verrucomicrobia bacterium]|nr:hypothetical protein [Verrucomicrobiota bacterium]
MIEEKGPWAVVFGNGNTYIESDDFTHDAHLYVRGDFESAEQRAEYAEEIARRLNAFFTAQEREALLCSKCNGYIAYSASLADEIESLKQQLAEAQAEALEQARIVGMGGEREIALREQMILLRNQVLEECAAVAEDTAAGRDAEAIADAIRARKDEE